MRTGHTSRELWSLDLDLLEWSRVETKTGQCMTSQGGNPKLCGPVHSMGHAACVIANRMIVIFGHSPKYGYLDTVQEYHFGKQRPISDPSEEAHFSFLQATKNGALSLPGAITSPVGLDTPPPLMRPQSSYMCMVATSRSRLTPPSPTCCIHSTPFQEYGRESQL